MDHSQLYIGTRNAVVVCVDQKIHRIISGRFFHSYDKKAAVFRNLEQLLFQMEQLFNTLKFPFPSTNDRFFETAKAADKADNSRRDIQRKEPERIMKDEELLRQHGDLGSFIIRVQHRQNSSWQGRITWMEKNQTVYFRSVWEMMKLIENAIDTVSPDTEEDPEPSWSRDLS